jgi:hypothetical protein
MMWLFRAMVPTPAAFSPCYMNIINIADVFVGEGRLLNLTEELRKYFDEKGWGPYFADCLAAPESEPHYSLPPLRFLKARKQRPTLQEKNKINEE